MGPQLLAEETPWVDGWGLPLAISSTDLLSFLGPLLSLAFTFIF